MIFSLWILQLVFVEQWLTKLTHCGLVMPYGDTDLGSWIFHCFVQKQSVAFIVVEWCILMAQWKTAVTPLLMHLNYYGLLLSIDICICALSLGSDNGLLPVWWQTIIWTDANSQLIGPLGTNLNEIRSKYNNFHSRNLISKCCQQNVSHFLGLSMLKI